MIRSYLLIAFRHLLKNSLFTIINVIGLGVGISVSLLLYQYVSYENSFDTWYQDQNKLYRVNQSIIKNEEYVSRSARSAPALGQTLMDEFAEIDQFTRSVILGEAIASFEDHHFREKNILLVDNRFFEMFNYEIVSGYPEKDMEEPMNVYVSERVVESLFQNEDPINKPLKLNSENLDGNAEFIIKGVFKDVPDNTHIRPNILISYATLHAFIGKEIDQSWNWNNLYTYIKTSTGVDQVELQSKINIALSEKVKEITSERKEEWVFNLQPVSRIHLENEVSGEFEPGIDGSILKYYIIIGVLILLIAYLNFINLYTAKASGRIKEIAVRKVNGAYRSQLIIQFMGEAFLLNLLGILCAMTILQFSGSIFQFFGINISQSFVKPLSLLPAVAVLLLIGTLISGIYPSLVMSGWNVTFGLKKNKNIKFGGYEIRKVLVVFQFIISSLLVAGTLTVFYQLDFISNYNLGFDIEQKLVVKAPRVANGKDAQNIQVFRNKILSNSDIRQVSAMDEIPGNEIYFKTNRFRRNLDESSNTTFTFLNIDQYYFDLFDIEILAGRGFVPEIDSTINSCILNESAIEALGFNSPEEATGSIVYMDHFKTEIVGVVEDFHQEGLKKEIFPQLFSNESYSMNYFVVDINSSEMSRTLNFIESEFREIYTDSPFEYYFLDDYYNQQYKSEILFSKVYTTFSALAIMIACLGLFGISYQSILEQTKEIGIRKVLGASVPTLFFQLTKGYLVLVIIAYLISIPIAYYVFNNWLDQFSARITLSWWFFVIPVVVLLTSVLLSVGFQTEKATRRNPVDSLRYE